MEEQFIENLDFASPETFVQETVVVPEPEPKPVKEKKLPKVEEVVQPVEEEPVNPKRVEQQGYGYKRFKQKMGR
jgi:hypothetical protein